MSENGGIRYRALFAEFLPLPAGLTWQASVEVEDYSKSGE